MKTCSITPAHISKKWVTVDASGMPLGRLASEIARVLRGKNKPYFVPHLDCGDNVIVTNADKVSLSGGKWDKKLYYRHTGYIGGIREISARDLLARNPERLVEYAVKGMLPKTKLGRKVIKNMRVFAGPEHNMSAQAPVEMAPRTKKVEEK
ncbi:MAG: 50S ribosomal protein L13 [Zetaproteobacteria bacterium]|nr:50S ribosomal protein L13 [Zetaproteobacteria bacterium]